MTKQIIDLLNELLIDEYRQRDFYETYSYYLFGLPSPGIQDHLKKHIAAENSHIEVLQRFLSGLGAEPLIMRKALPKIKNISLQKILEIDLELELQAVKNYSNAISILESAGPAFASLRVALENILNDEQEHVHDITRWLRHDLCIDCK